jgi:hypothetical protein
LEHRDLELWALAFGKRSLPIIDIVHSEIVFTIALYHFVRPSLQSVLESSLVYEGMECIVVSIAVRS